MAYLHCHTPKCGWSQDDFWEIGEYTPFRKDLVNDMEQNLFRDKIYMDSSFFKEIPEIPSHKDSQGTYCKGQDFVAWKLENKSKSVKNMLVRTEDEFIKNKSELKCPKCGLQNFDID